MYYSMAPLYVIKLPLPEDVRHLQEISCLGNYGGKIALLSRLYSLTLDLHVLEDAIKQEWSKVSIVVPSKVHLVPVSLSLHPPPSGALSVYSLTIPRETLPKKF